MFFQLAYSLSISYYMRTYQRYAYEFWENLTPSQYGMVLVAVFVAGYLMMKSAR